MATIARRTAIDIHRREARRPTVQLDEASLIDLPEGVDQSFDVWAVRGAIDALPPLEREVVRLQHLESLTQAEIAERLGVPVGTIKSRSFRAHWLLAARLATYGERANDRGSAHPRAPVGVYLGRGDDMTTDDDRIAYLAGDGSGALDYVDQRDLDELKGFLPTLRCGQSPRATSKTAWSP